MVSGFHSRLLGVLRALEQTPNELEDQVRRRLAEVLAPEVVDQWFAEMELRERADGTVEIALPTMKGRWVRRRYQEVLEVVVEQTLGSAAPIAIISSDRPAPPLLFSELVALPPVEAARRLDEAGISVREHPEVALALAALVAKAP